MNIVSYLKEGSIQIKIVMRPPIWRFCAKHGVVSPDYVYATAAVAAALAVGYWLTVIGHPRS